MTPGTATATPAGIGTAEAFGSATVVTTTLLGVTGIASGELFGSAQVNLSVAGSGIVSSEAVGFPTLLTAVTLVPPSIVSGELFGTATLFSGSVFIQAAGISSRELFGTAQLYFVNVTAWPPRPGAFTVEGATPGTATVSSISSVATTAGGIAGSLSIETGQADAPALQGGVTGAVGTT